MRWVLEKSSPKVERWKITFSNRLLETVIKVSLSCRARLELVLFTWFLRKKGVLYISRKVYFAIGTLGEACFTLAIGDFGY